jgi:hypothetical protein
MVNQLKSAFPGLEMITNPSSAWLCCNLQIQSGLERERFLNF